MSQEQPPTPKPQPPSTPARSTSAHQRGAQALQDTWRRAKPILKTGSVKVLRATVRTLEWAIAKLEAPSKPDSPQPGPVTSSTAIRTTPAKSLAQSAAASPEAGGQPSRPALRVLAPLQGGWRAALGQIRSRLPGPWRQLSDPVLSGIIAAGVLLLVWATTAILPSPQAASVPNDPVTTPLTAPPELSAPQAPAPVEAAPAVVLPPPAPELTPEQKLLADLQQQTGSPYAQGLLQSIQADFPGGHLTLKLSPQWYALSPAEQDTFVEELRRQSQALFSKLDVTDLDGTLLARSPVVGENMVILKRHTALAPAS